MLRQEHMCVWILVLLTAGIGVNIHLAAWAVEMNLWDATVWVYGTVITAKAALPAIYHISDLCALGAVILLAVGLPAASSDSCSKERPVKVRV